MTRAACIAATLSLLVAAGDARADRRSAAPAPAPADERRRTIGILQVEGASPDIAAQFEASLEQQLDTKHYWLAPRARMREQLRNSTRWTEGCLVGLCLNEARAQTGADLVLLAALTGSGTSFGYVVTLVRTDTGRVLAQHGDRCEVCTINEAISDATLATIRLLNEVPERLPDETAPPAAALDVAVGRTRRELRAHARHTRRVGLTMTVLGVAATAGGVALYMMMDKDDEKYGIATMAAGGGLALGGVTVLAF